MDGIVGYNYNEQWEQVWDYMATLVRLINANGYKVV